MKNGQEDIILWNEYLIYSIIFGYNDNLAQEIYNKYVKNAYKDL